MFVTNKRFYLSLTTAQDFFQTVNRAFSPHTCRFEKGTRVQSLKYTILIDAHFVFLFSPQCLDNEVQVLLEYKQWQLQRKIRHPTDTDAMEAC